MYMCFWCNSGVIVPGKLPKKGESGNRSILLSYVRIARPLDTGAWRATRVAGAPNPAALL